MMNNVSFRQFYAVWYLQNKKPLRLSPAKFHKEVFDFLLDYDNWENGTGVLQVFRNGAKSTIVALFITYLLVKDPRTTILVQSADDRTARKILAGVQDLIRTHPLAQHLRQTEREWQKGSFFVAGAVDPQNPSVVGFGIKSNITGRRAHWIIYDDVEAKANANTEDKRDEIRDRVSEGMNIMHEGGKRLFVGTPHAFDTLYSDVANKGASKLHIPMLLNASGKWPNMVGDCVWSERFNEDEVNKKQRTVPEHEWMSQNMLIPWNMTEAMFDTNHLKQYESEVDIGEANGSTYVRINDKKMLSVSTYWDVSSGKSGRDDSVLAVVYTAEDGHYYIHRTVKLSGDIDQQCAKIKQVALDLMLPNVTVETNGVGVHASHILRKELKSLGVAVVEKHQSTNKGERIVNALQSSLSARMLHVHKDVFWSPFRVQLREFSFTSNKSKDDYVDSVASAILLEPIRVNAGGAMARRRNASWGNYSTGSYTAEKYNPFAPKK